ncbi:MAG TPA: hypothetical protein DCS07_01320, partial [Bdellovibrionales bacterium]|nr:hypothetical protein [Bdellovibrionales bacterium]
MSPLRSTGTSDELKIIFGILLWVVGPLFFQTIRKLHPLKAVWEMMRLIRMPARRRPGVRIGEAQIPDEARLRHTHIVGATGTGKTVLIEQLIFSDLRRGAGALIIDPKGERTFYEEVKRYCIEIGRGDDLYLLSATFPEESAIWNPCGLGNVSELQTKFYNSAIYNEPHYAKACEYGLLTAFGELTKKYKDGFTIQELLAELKRLEESDRKNIVTGLFFDLNNLAHGEWEPILACGSRAKSVRARSISILDVVTQNKILFVDLPTEGKRVQSSRIGRLLTQEILLISGMRKRNPELIG